MPLSWGWEKDGPVKPVQGEQREMAGNKDAWGKPELDEYEGMAMEIEVKGEFNP